MIIHLELSPYELNDISYFSMGNFTFEKDGVCFTSKNRKPDQSCMLLLSLPQLFIRLIRMKKGEIRKFVFSPSDCSYSLLFEKQKDKLLISEYSHVKLICEIDEFAQALHREVSDYLSVMILRSVNWMLPGMILLRTGMNLKPCFRFNPVLHK